MPRPHHPRLLGWRTVVVCLVVGVMVNVGVAWAFAARGQMGLDPEPRHAALFYLPDAVDPYGADMDRRVEVDELRWPLAGFEPSGGTPTLRVELDWPWHFGCSTLTWERGWVSELVMPDRFRRSLTVFESDEVREWRFGLPLRSLSGFRVLLANGQAEPAWMLDTGVTMPPQPLTTTNLPLRPIFPGFIVNTLFYAGLVFAPVVGARVLRRRRRAKRGRCIACGYELADLTACPECGLGRGE